MTDPAPAAVEMKGATSSIDALLERLQPRAREATRGLVTNQTNGVVLFFSATNGTERAKVITVRDERFAVAWEKATQALRQVCPDARWLRLDWVTGTQRMTFRNLRRELAKTKRNYFRLGIALDERLECAFLEAELNANAMLYGGNKISHAILNEQNFRRYARIRHGLEEVDFSPRRNVWLFSTDALFVSADEQAPVALHGSGRNVGRRNVGSLDVPTLDSIISAGGAYLAAQIEDNGRFIYGVHPCFDRSISAYNNLRHASSLYALLETWELTRDEAQLAGIERALGYLTEEAIRTVTREGVEMAFLVEGNGEIKLGGNGVCLLALVKYSEIFETNRYYALLQKLALGILAMQDAETGSFDHVLEYPSLEVKEAFRIIYYEGEAAFGLMRLYGLTGDPRWLEAVERAFEHFITKEHWKAHDHWLGYCVNELTRHQPDERYFRFGLRNFQSHLAFVLDRITTFPTLLELMTSAEQLVARLEGSPEHRHLLDSISRQLFFEALHFRAHYLLNGFFWPELAMFFARPNKIAGSFFIRHHAFRVRIDDVEHYVSGLIAYRKFLTERGSLHPPQIDALEWQPTVETGWNARNVALATGGNWIVPPSSDWRATGVFIHPPGFFPGRMAAVRLKEGERGVPLANVEREKVKPAALILSDCSKTIDGIPALLTDTPQDAVMNLARYARDRFTGRVIGVTGSAGKTTMVAMMAAGLQPFGLVGQTGHNANLPLGVAWNLASMRWTDPHIVVELGIGRMEQSARLAKPDLAIFTNILPAHLEYHRSTRQVARLKSRVFLGMERGSIAILNRDMDEWETVHEAAIARGLKIVHYGAHKDCDVRLVRYDSESQEVLASIDGKSIAYRLGSAGEHMAMNSLAVIAAASALGHPLEPVLEAIGSFTPLAGRGAQFQSNLNGHQITVIDEAYNANPGSMRAALRLLGSKKAPRRVAVLGEMAELGSDSQTYHTGLAPLIDECHIDRVHVIGDLYAEFWDALPTHVRGSRNETLDELDRELEKDLKADDCVLFKGSHSTGLHRFVDRLRQGSQKLKAPTA